MDQLASGKVSRAYFVKAIIDGAEANDSTQGQQDAQRVANQAEVARYFSEELAGEDPDNAEAVLSDVTADPDSVDTAKTQAEEMVASGGSAPEKGLVAAYGFAGDARDSSGQGNHAEAKGAQLTEGPSGQSATAYAFDGDSNDRVVLGVSELFQADRSFSVHTAFCWQDGSESYETIFSKNGHYGVGLNAYDGGELHFDLRQAGPSWETSDNPEENPEAVASIERDRWYEATIVADAEDGEIRLYLNGELAGTDAWDGTVRDVNDPAVLGVRENAASSQKDFKGKIAEALIYDRPLGAVAVQDLQTPSVQEAGVCQPAGSETDLLARYPLDGTLADATGNGWDPDQSWGTAYVDGVSGQAVAFGGAGTGVLLDDPQGGASVYGGEGFFPRGTRTISLWFQPQSHEGTQVLYEEGGASNGLNLYLAGATLYAGAWAEGNGWYGRWLSAETEGEIGAWHHAALVYDHGGSGEMRLYLDCSLAASGDTGATMRYHPNPAGLAGTIGDTKFHTGDYAGDESHAPYHAFAGALDDVRIHDAALSGAAIGSLAAR